MRSMCKLLLLRINGVYLAYFQASNTYTIRIGEIALGSRSILLFPHSTSGSYLLSHKINYNIVQ